ncbi:sulfate transporter family-domain-containing protein [Cladochytrium replicatum]|nr:sulfate transporter family-domain-containing protein [Cladochytrium replicatum]
MSKIARTDVPPGGDKANRRWSTNQTNQHLTRSTAIQSARQSRRRANVLSSTLDVLEDSDRGISDVYGQLADTFKSFWKKRVRKQPLFGNPTAHEGDIEASYDQNVSSKQGSHFTLGIFRYLFPIIDQLLGGRYSWGMFIGDGLAALTVTVVIVPQALAFASVAGVSPITGLVSACFPVMIYSLFGSSRQLSVGPEALTSLLVGVTISHSDARESLGPDVLATVLALLVGICTLVLATLRAGYIDNTISGYLLTGYITGVAFLIMLQQIPNMLGLAVPQSKGETPILQSFFSAIITITPDKIHMPTLIIGLANVAFLFIIPKIKHWIKIPIRRFCMKSRVDNEKPITLSLSLVPEIFILVASMIGISAGMDLQGTYNVHVVGQFNNTLPIPAIPPLTGTLFSDLLQSALVIALVGFVQSQAVTKNYGLKNNYFPSGGRELFALGAANLFGSLFGAYVSSGSLPRSNILAKSHGKTTFASFLTSVLVLVTILTLKNVLALLPKCTLAAIVFISALNQIKWSEIFFAARMGALLELLQMMLTLLVTITTPISNGIIVCIILAGMLILRKTTLVNMVVLAPDAEGIDNQSRGFAF